LIRIWPNEPFVQSGTTSDQLKALVFPSGRQAISHAIELLGGRREWLVAIPEYSGHCLISAVAKNATPLPITAACECAGSVEVVVLYCQWGWEKPHESLVEVQDRFPTAKIVLDRVDSLADSLDGLLWKGVGEDVLQVFSLSKTLGLAGGGLIHWQGGWVENERTLAEGDKGLAQGLQDLRGRLIDAVARDTIKVWGMADVQTLSPGLVQWLENNDLLAVIRLAAERRIACRSVVIDHLDILDWPAWMIEQLQSVHACVPGVLPLFIRCGENAQPLKNDIKKEIGVEVGLYHFDQSPSYLKPNWTSCIAVPSHGQMTAQKLEQIIGLWETSPLRARADESIVCSSSK
jgi:hypothetical protein